MKIKPAFIQTYKVEIIHQQQTETTKIILNSSLSRKNAVWQMRTGPTQAGTEMEGNLHRELSRQEVHICILKYRLKTCGKSSFWVGHATF